MAAQPTHLPASEWPDLALLDLLLARERMARSPEVWFHIHKLLLRRFAGGNYRPSAEDLAHLIGPLVCKNSQQQQRLPVLINEWLNVKTPAVAATAASPLPKALAGRHKRLRRYQRRSLIAATVVFMLLTAAALTLVYWPQPPAVTLPEPAAEALPVPTTPVVDDAAIPISDWIAPNPLPPPVRVPANWQRLLRLLDGIVPGLPVLAALLYLIWRYRGRTVLRNQAPQGEKLLTGLHFNPNQTVAEAPFSGPELAAAAGKLLRPLWIDSRRLHVEDSVIATAEHAGFFTPRYRQRHVYPEYLVLVQSNHGNDQMAAFAELLVDALKQQKLLIRSYRFRADPRRLVPWIQPPEGADRSALSLAELAQKRGGARLIVISDWEVLFQPYYPDQVQAWAEDFEHWTRRVWLSPGFQDAAGAKRAAVQAARLKFPLLPLAGEKLPELVASLLREEGRSAFTPAETDSDYLPPLLGESADAWLDWRPPHGADLKRLLKELQTYLGKDGFFLLQALAVFPKPLWPLPQVLDVQLFADSPERRSRFRRWLDKRRADVQIARPQAATDRDRERRLAREQRLARISRLPWSRHAYLPDYLRLRLLKTLKGPERRRIRTAWAGLLDRLSRSENPETLNLPITLPKINTLRLEKLIAAEPRHSALNDPIFANILLGGKLGLLDFRLPVALARLLPGAGKRLDFRPALATAAFAAAGAWGLHDGWQTQARQPLIDFWQRQIERENAAWLVDIGYRSDARDLAAALAQSLAAAEFQARHNPSSPTWPHNRIGYPPGGLAVAERVAERLAWLSYGAEVDLVAAPALAAKLLSVQLQYTYQPRAVFHDDLRHAYRQQADATKPANPGVAPLEPDMVVIKPGIFLMGSPKNEAGRGDDEGPQHKVRIGRPFAIGKYEVTQKQWQAVMGNNPSHFNGDDLPVERVTWTEVQQYIAKLNASTGKNYRLPSEAEWEYAARAGTTTAFYWGNGKQDNYAWYSGNSGDKTHPVGQRKPNAFGLFDMAGNVWEWTEDCWHDSYNAAPENGTAWLEGSGGDCGRRMFRGGSWNYNPQNLRSASRDGYYTAGGSNYFGFRLARAL